MLTKKAQQNMSKQEVLGTKEVLFCTFSASEPEKFCLDTLVEFGKRFIDLAGLKHLHMSYQEYPGGGYTVLFFLLESHLIIETYFEHGIFELEVAICGGGYSAEDVLKQVGQDFPSFLMLEMTKVKKNARHGWSVE